ncbi:MAG: ABC transporter ATP-binding protein [Bacteroidaceae bacterium]|nr:ABC transporter ATP-binding protein [Bacteroidaceae bacterium]
MIELKGVGRVFRTSEVETIALENVNISIGKGEFVAIMGPSGCGKSTLLNIMGLLDRPTEGEVILNGTPTGSLSDRRAAAFRNSTVGFVFQSFHLIPSLNVLQNVEMPLLYCGMSEGKRRERARQLLEQVGMSHRLRHLPSQLSGGQSQRVAIARAMACNPDILLADEPTGNLDSHMSAEIMQLLLNLNSQEGRTIVMVTHNEEQARQAGRIIRFFDGRQVE